MKTVSRIAQFSIQLLLVERKHKKPTKEVSSRVKPGNFFTSFLLSVFEYIFEELKTFFQGQKVLVL